MRVVVQRVKEASVSVDGREISSIGQGLLLLVGFTHNDDLSCIDYMVRKIKNLRIFDDSDGIMNLSFDALSLEVLSVSQFTLYADTKKGNRPSYINAMTSSDAKGLYDLFNEKLIQAGLSVKTGEFGADMQVSLVNDGPITILLER